MTSRLQTPQRSRFARRRFRQSWSGPFYVVGAVVGGIGVAMLPAALVAAWYRELPAALGLLGAAAVCVGIGLTGWRVLGSAGKLSVREGFASVGLSWIAMSLFGALPFLLSGGIPSVTDAFFETTSGFTTTGSSILADPGALPRGLLFWRATTQWIGGMGIIVLSVAILPLLGVGGVQLARAESPGPEPDRLTPRFADTARRLWFVYVGMTVLEALLLWWSDMDWFQAVTHAMTTLSTGGFGTEATSLDGFSAVTQWIVIVFMLLAGASFALHYRALVRREPIAFVRSAEARLYVVVVAVATLLIGGGLLDTGELAVGGLGAAEELVRTALFTALTLVTTTGYATADFGAWAPGLQIAVLGLMFTGGMTGSTSGSVKAFRLGMLTKAAATDLRKLVHPRGVFASRFGDRAVGPDVIRNVQSFFLFYMFIFMTGTFLLGVIGTTVGSDFGFITYVSAAAQAIGNIGPGLGEVGPTSNFAEVPMLGKWLLAGMMLVGRLEIFPILLLFTRWFWRG